MKRILTSFALLTMVLAPAASFARDRDGDRYRDAYRDQQNYYQQGYYQQGYDQPGYVQQGYAAPYRYDRSSYGYRQNVYVAPPAYNYGYDGSAYGYEGHEGLEHAAPYVGGGAVAGAVLGAILGHGAGAAVGAVVGGVGGYLYHQHRDRGYYGYGY